jgi:hypothetical protein
VWSRVRGVKGELSENLWYSHPGTNVPPALRAAVIFQVLDACAISSKSDILRATEIT